jgi:hypothetical protein
MGGLTAARLSVSSFPADEEQAGADLGQPFRDQRLGRRCEHQRLFQSSLPLHQVFLLEHALRLMPRIGLVQHQPDQSERRPWRVGADANAAVKVAGVLVIAGPWPALHQLDVQTFPGR